KLLPPAGDMCHQQARRPSVREIALTRGLGDEALLGRPLRLQQMQDVFHLR
ncbi:MAG: hypothetical protein QOJ33_2474, partial [Chloroflexota bacterium]|nr:hypothetical protein [Chloroflexota bacterium]